ncbi:MAG: hypothetical protein IPJ26_12075 [Bacteroidetes bacterium]|nr:hypothetical protein [Bacteroidota bacterium]
MKKHISYFLITFFFILGGNAFAQKKPTLINTSLTKPEMAIMYVGVENVIMVYGEIPGKYIRMERSGGPLEVRPGMAMRALLKYTEIGFDTLRVFDNDKLIIEKVYEIKKLSSYAIGIKGTRDSVLTKEEFLKAKSLELFMPGGYYKPKQKISTYTLTILSESGKVIQKVTVEGINFNAALELHLDKIQPRSSILFSDIKAILGDNNIKKFDPFKIRIK